MSVDLLIFLESVLSAYDQKLEVLFVVTNFYLGPETGLCCLVSVSKVLIAANRTAQIARYTGKKN